MLCRDSLPDTALQETQLGNGHSSSAPWDGDPDNLTFRDAKSSGLTVDKVEAFPLSDEGYITKVLPLLADLTVKSIGLCLWQLAFPVVMQYLGMLIGSKALSKS